MHAARIRIVRIDAGIVHLPFLRIRQHIVRVVDFLELVFEFRTCDVGMVFAAHLSIRLFDLVVACRTVDAQHFVIVRHDYSFSCWFCVSLCHKAGSVGRLTFIVGEERRQISGDRPHGGHGRRVVHMRRPDRSDECDRFARLLRIITALIFRL